jgi:CDP-diacylglycerol--glycerol-3-phosphate 3-phosphatidyltransferase
MLNVPNILSAMRLVMAPILLALAWFGYPRAFLVCFTGSLLSDMADGFLARARHQTSELGAKLDSWGDLAMYLTLPLSAWWLWSDLILREWPWVALALGSFVIPTLVGLAKYGRLTSYHTYGAKLSALIMGPAMLVLFAFDYPWPFRLAALIFLLAEIEEIAITAVLPEWHADVRSLVHARRIAGAAR